MFSAHFSLEGVPQDKVLDPPFRAVDVVEHASVRTMAALLRAAWDDAPPAAVQAAFDAADALADPERARDAREDAVGTYLRAHSRMSAAERRAQPRNPATQDAFLPWRCTLYGMWGSVFADTAAFLWSCNALAGHWHADFTDLHPGDDKIGQLVLRHGQHGVGAVHHTFKHNVIICPAYFGPGIRIRAERLPVNAHLLNADGQSLPSNGAVTNGSGNGSGSGTANTNANGSSTAGRSSVLDISYADARAMTYALPTRMDIDTYTNDSGTVLWWLRRDVPFVFHVEPDENIDDGPVPEDGSLAAVMVYGHLCMICNLDAQIAAEERAAENEDNGGEGGEAVVEKADEDGRIVHDGNTNDK